MENECWSRGKVLAVYKGQDIGKVTFSARDVAKPERKHLMTYDQNTFQRETTNLPAAKMVPLAEPKVEMATERGMIQEKPYRIR